MQTIDELKQRKKEIQAREIDNLKKQCDDCKLHKPHMTTDCRIYVNLVQKNSPIAWKNKHLFIANNQCKHFVQKKGRK